MIDRDLTYVSWVTATGETIPLSGYQREGTAGVWLGGAAKNLDRVEAKAIFDAAARQRGETFVAFTHDHAEIELPLFILGDSSYDLRLRRAHLKRAMHPDAPGWLVVATATTGIRWQQARRIDMTPAHTKDVDLSTGLHVDVVLAAEDPFAQTRPHQPQWQNTTGADTVTATLFTDPGPDQDSWPVITFVGPGKPRFRYGPVDFDLDIMIKPGEAVLIVTDQARPTIRGRMPDGTQRNLLPLLKGRKFTAPALRDQITRLDVTISGASAQTQLMVTTAQAWEGLM